MINHKETRVARCRCQMTRSISTLPPLPGSDGMLVHRRVTDPTPPSIKFTHGSLWPAGRFSKAPESVRARKATFRSSVSKNRDMYTPENSCMKGTSLHISVMWIKQLCNRQVRDVAMALRARKVSGAFEKRPPGLESGPHAPKSTRRPCHRASHSLNE